MCPKASSTSITWEFVKNENCKASPQTHGIGNSGAEARQSVLICPPGDSNVRC